MDVKLLILLLLGCSGTQASLSDQISALAISPDMHQKLGQVVGAALLNHFREIIPIVPAISCELGSGFLVLECKVFEETPFYSVPEEPLPDIHASEPPGGSNSGLITGELHICDTNVTGLSTLLHGMNATVTVLPLSSLAAILKYRMSGSPAVNGTHSIGAALLLELLHVESFGYFEARVNNLRLDVELEVGFDSMALMEVRSTLIYIDFDNITVHADHSVWFGQEVNWVAVSEEITDSFRSLWPIVRTFLSPIVSRILTTEFVGYCGIDDILDLAGCLGGGEAPSGLVYELMGTFKDGGNRDERCLVPYEPPPMKTTERPVDPDDGYQPGSAPAQVHLAIILTAIAATLNFIF